MKRIGVIFIMMIVLATIGGKAQGRVMSANSESENFQEKISETYDIIARHDADAALKALLDIDIENYLYFHSTDEATAEIIAISTKASEVFSDAPIGALIKLYEATVYYLIYNRNSYLYDQREGPLLPFPPSVTEWTGAQFKKKIEGILDEVLTGGTAERLKSQYTTDYLDVIYIDPILLPYYPTLLDFAYDYAIDRLDLKNDYTVSLIDRALEQVEPGSAEYMPLISKKYSGYSDIGSLQAVFEKYADDRYAGYLLDKLFEKRSYTRYSIGKESLAFDKWLNRHITEYLTKFPETPFRRRLENENADICSPNVSCSVFAYCCPNSDILCRINIYNTDKIGLYIYRKPDEFVEYSKSKVAKSDLLKVDSTTFTIDSVAPFYHRIEHIIKVPEYGDYIVYVDDCRSDSICFDDVALVQCISAYPVAISELDNPKVMVFDPVTGAPKKSAKVLLYDNIEDIRHKFTTNKKGVADIRIPEDERYSLAVKADKWTTEFERIDIEVDNYDEYPVKNILTDKSLYHFGEKVHVLFVLFDQNKGKYINYNGSLKVSLYGPNSNKIHEVECVPDVFGRYICELYLPEAGMSGEYKIETGSKNIGYEFKHITVSDYRLPQFEVILDKPMQNQPEKGDVTLCGRAVTYSGMPIQDAEVELFVDITLSWRDYSTNYRSKKFSMSTKSDSLGRFSFVVPDSMLTYKDRLYVATISVKDNTGNIIEAIQPFTNQKPYRIEFEQYSQYIDANKPFEPKIALYSPDDTRFEAPLLWSLKDYNEVDLSGTYTGSIDFSSVLPGIYEFTVEPVDEALAEEKSVIVCIYNTDSDLVPGWCKLWVKDNVSKYSHDTPAEILYGVKCDSTYVNFVTIGDNKVINIDTRCVDRGYHTYSVPMSDDFEYVDVMIFTIDNCNIFKYKVCIESDIDKELLIECNSFRDRLVPGDSECWELTVKDATDRGVESAVALDMYNKALDKLCPHEFKLFGAEKIEYDDILQDLENLYLKAGFTNYVWPLPGLYSPNFSFYEKTEGDDRIYIRGLSSPIGNGNGYGQVIVAGMTSSKGPTSNFLKAEELFSAREPEVSHAQYIFDYRAKDESIAIWAPGLTTDADGNLTYSFTVPNANTTWRLQAVAWTKDAYAGHLVRDFVASKPVMVQPNLPRFLRVDDRAVVLASVMNNTDSTAVINTVVELFNPYTSKIIEHKEFTNALDGKATATLAVDISASDELDAIGYRVRSSNGKFSDGEQAVIRILPNENALIETTPFYLNPGETEYSTILPNANDARLSLTFCENPTWTIVTALPGLRTEIDDYANSAAAALFSASIARGIVKENPAIGKAIKMWQENPTDSALVSMLEKNEDLKIALLNATPWVQAAQSETERMANLALIFNEKETDAVIYRAIDILASIQGYSSGWKWAKWCDKPSKWVTCNILCMFANLKSLGWLPDDTRISKMTSSALSYWDKAVDDTDIIYTLIRPQFPEVEIPEIGKDVICNTLLEIQDEWKSYTLPYRAMAAEALYVNDRKKLAEELMHSISAMGEWTPSQGLRFPRVNALYEYASILEAYAMILPESKEVDGLRQQLIVRKQGTNWGSAVVTTEVVQSILSSGSNWTVDASGNRGSVGLRPADNIGASIKVGDKEIKPSSPVETATGNIRADLTPYKGETLTVTTPGTSQAYGAVYAQFSQLMSDVKASGCDDLDIEKVMYKREGLEWVPATDMKVGDRVKVQLTIHCKRNLQYVEIIDERPAAFEPVDQLPDWVWSEGTRFYRENRDSRTQLHVQWLNPGTYLLSYEMNVNTAGTYSSGVASIQSQYAPEISAHSSGKVIEVK